MSSSLMQKAILPTPPQTPHPSPSAVSTDLTGCPPSKLESSAKIIFPDDIPSLDDVFDEVDKTFGSREVTPEMEVACHMATQANPFFPAAQIVFGGVWAEEAWLRLAHHRTENYEDALDNIPGSETFSDREKLHLAQLITHRSGWGPTPKHHRNAPGFRYLNLLYPQFGGELVPVLDNCLWPEDAPYLPTSTQWAYECLSMYHFTLALLYCKGGYYCYEISTDPCGPYKYMWKAGNSLEEVYEGLKAERMKGSDRWHCEEPIRDWEDVDLYFPVDYTERNGLWELTNAIPEPPDVLERDPNYSFW